MKRFGPVEITELEHIDVPVGLHCERCLVAIKEGDQGFVIEDGAWHQECLLEAILGPRWAGSFPRSRGTTP